MLKNIEGQETNAQSAPHKPVVIARCGLLEGAPFGKPAESQEAAAADKKEQL